MLSLPTGHVTSSPSSAQAHHVSQRCNQDEPETNLDEPRFPQVQLRPGSSYKLDLSNTYLAKEIDTDKLKIHCLRQKFWITLARVIHDCRFA